LAGIATLLGALMIFDAGYARSLAQGAGPVPREFSGQILFVIVAMSMGWLVSRWRIESFQKGAKILFGLSLALLFAVELFGRSMNGARRWLVFGPISIQPAEFVKISAIVFLAAILATRKPWQGPKKQPRDWADWLDRVGGPKFVRGLPIFIALAAAYLIEREPDLGTAAVIVFIVFAMMIFGGVSWKSILALTVLGGIGLFAMIKAEPYRMDRIVNHAQRWQPDHVDDTGYQTTQSETAMASGGWTGVGIGAGRAKHMLPAATTDFILATIGEELGLIGSLGVLGLLGWITFRLIWLSRQASNRFSQLVLAGTATWIGIQTCTNMMMANGLLPAIGIPLPFISSGGSSLIALWIGIGLCQAAVGDKPTKMKPEASEEIEVAPLRGRVGERRPAPDREPEVVYAE
jgi:cell division protein FtsW